MHTRAPLLPPRLNVALVWGDEVSTLRVRGKRGVYGEGTFDWPFPISIPNHGPGFKTFFYLLLTVSGQFAHPLQSQTSTNGQSHVVMGQGTKHVFLKLPGWTDTHWPKGSNTHSEVAEVHTCTFSGTHNIEATAASKGKHTQASLE